MARIISVSNVNQMNISTDNNYDEIVPYVLIALFLHEVAIMLRVIEFFLQVLNCDNFKILSEYPTISFDFRCTKLNSHRRDISHHII